ncbi:MAG: hypothetical protein IJ247_06550 [Bacilli bacterium]|nr:hypothetical protein [Bacilli bacterium]
MSNKTSKIITLILDILITIMVITSLFMMVLGGTGTLSVQGLDAFKYFTVDSNALMGLCALVLVPFDILVLLGKKEKTPKAIKVLFHIGLVGVTLTLLTVLFFLGIIYGYQNMFLGANLFMHLLTPVTALIRFIFFGNDEGEMQIFPCTIYGTIPMIIYGIVYFINVGVHGGYGDVNYDWYMFGAGGPWTAPLIFLAMLSFTYGISFLTYFVSKKVRKKLYKQ